MRQIFMMKFYSVIRMDWYTSNKKVHIWSWPDLESYNWWQWSLRAPLRFRDSFLLIIVVKEV